MFLKLSRNEAKILATPNILISPVTYLRYLNTLKRLYMYNTTKLESDKTAFQTGIAKYETIGKQVS
jgi:hypothetical protein